MTLSPTTVMVQRKILENQYIFYMAIFAPPYALNPYSREFHKLGRGSRGFQNHDLIFWQIYKALMKKILKDVMHLY